MHVFQCLTFSESATEMLLDQKKKKERRNEKEKPRRRMEKGKKALEAKFSVYYSVVDICCQKLHIAMVISKIKRGILSHRRMLLTLPWFPLSKLMDERISEL